MVQAVAGSSPVAHPRKAHLGNLVTGSVREDPDLDFKQDRYGESEQRRRELAGDLAAMGNGRGGLIVIGIRDENDVAVELTPVELVDGEEARIHQIAAGIIDPHLTFDVRVIPSGDDPGRGYYLLIVPPSTLRPHAFRKDRDLRFPLRDGTTTRWLSEPEVADMYRNRFTVAAGQAGRLDRILTRRGQRRLDLHEEAFVVVALVPTGRGSMPIDLARVAAVGEWARTEIGQTNWFEGLFDRQAPPAPGVAAHRVTLTTPFRANKPPEWMYVELNDDGAGFACQRLPDDRRGRQGSEGSGAVWIFERKALDSVGSLPAAPRSTCRRELRRVG